LLGYATDLNGPKKLFTDLLSQDSFSCFAVVWAIEVFSLVAPSKSRHAFLTDYTLFLQVPFVFCHLIVEALKIFL
jgi:hypothetical protein